MTPDKQTLEQLRIDRSAAPRRRPLVPLVVGLLAIIAGVAAVIYWQNRPQSIAVRTIQVQRRTANSDRTLLNASGYVTARRAATVSSKVTGRLMEVLVEEGMKVEDQQVLARIDSVNVRMSLQLAEAQLVATRTALEETRANLRQAEREMKRVTRLAKNRAASQADLDLATTSVESTNARLNREIANVTVVEREIEVWKQQLDDTIIRAPFAGVVTSKNAQPGEMVSPVSAGGGFVRTGICTLVDMSSLEIEVDVSESYINRVEAEQPVVATLDSYPDWRIPAHVIAIVPTADRQKATVKVRVGIEQLDPRILPEMSVKVAFQDRKEPNTVQSEPKITIPSDAVRQQDGQSVVWIVKSDQAERRAISISEIIGDQTAVDAGIEGGERVVVEGFDKLTDGALVVEKNDE